PWIPRCLLVGGMLGSLVAPRGLGPVHDRPPAGEILAAPVLVLQVVGVLPEIVDEQREAAMQLRMVMRRGGQHLEPAALFERPYEPHPAAAAQGCAGLIEARLELVVGTEVAGNRVA